MKAIILVTLWILSGLPAAGWFNAYLRKEYCHNYLDATWAQNNQIVLALGGPVATVIGIMEGDYYSGWTLSRQPVKSCTR